MKNAAQIQCWALGGLALALLAMAGWSQSPDKEASIRLTIKVPDPNAMLYVDDTLTRQKGAERFFESPPVSTSKKYYYYKLKVTWLEGGKEKTESRKVKVEPGKENNIDLTKPEPKKTTDKKTTDKKVTDKAKPADKKTTDKKATDKKATDKKADDKAPPLDLFPKADTKKSTDTKKNGNDKKPIPDDKGASTPRAREFLFTYAATVTGLQPGQAARIWVPVPPSNEDQRVRVVPRAQPFRG
jgi:uncharacterized protein (TIGR03000 family)